MVGLQNILWCVGSQISIVPVHKWCVFILYNTYCADYRSITLLRWKNTQRRVKCKVIYKRVCFFLAEKLHVDGISSKSYRLHRNLCIRIEKKTKAGFHFTRLPPYINCNILLDLREIHSGYKSDILFVVKLFRACNDVHLLFVRCMWPEDSTGNRSHQTLYNYNTDGK